MNSHKLKALCLLLGMAPLVGLAPQLYGQCLDAPVLGGGGILTGTSELDMVVLVVGQPTVGYVEIGGVSAHLGGVPCWRDRFPSPAELPGDLNGDGCVGRTDLAMLLANYGQTGCDLVGDIVRDGVVNIADQAALLADYDNGCP